jgi:V8-like Glu-specific endopeptidase
MIIQYLSTGARWRTTCALLLLAQAPALGATLKIESLKNTATTANSGALTAKELEEVRPLPSEQVTPQELEDMRRRYREINPDTLQLERKSSVAPLAKGVPEKVADPSANNPYWSTGRLVFRMNDGKLYSCTAQFVDDLKVILTAAHCVYNFAAQGWNSDFTFQRAYSDGTTAQTVGWRCLSIFDAYHTPSKNRGYDYAFILADKNDEEKPLTMAIGTPPSKPLTAVGYPRNYGDGKFLYKVDGDWASEDSGIVTMSGNPMRHGNSGGAWFSGFKVDGGLGDNLVFSLNSGHLEGNDTEELGPLFTGDTLKLKDHVRDGKCL